jgi:hypothetical protein
VAVTGLLIVPLVALISGRDLALTVLAAIFAEALAPILVLLAHALGRRAFARLARLPVGRPELRVFVRIAGADRTAARLGALIAGTVAAYLAVAALAFAFARCQGLQTGTTSIVIAEVMDGFDAGGKLQPGDRILAVDGEPLLAYVPPSLTERVVIKGGAAVTLTVRRAGALLDVTIQPRLNERHGARPIWLLGVRLTLKAETVTDAASAAAFAIPFPLSQGRVVAEQLVASGATVGALAIPSSIMLVRELAWAPASMGLAADDDEADPGGPVRIVDEFRRGSSLDPAIQIAWMYALSSAVFALLVLAIFDLAAAVALLRARRRPRAAAPSASI